MANTLKTHRLLQRAKSRALGDKAKEAQFQAYFTEGRYLNDLGTLRAIGRKVGLTDQEVGQSLKNEVYRQKVEADSREAQALGARGVHFFVLNRQYTFSGPCLPRKCVNPWKKPLKLGRKETWIFLGR